MLVKYRILFTAKKLLNSGHVATYSAIKQTYKKCPPEDYLRDLYQQNYLIYTNSADSTGDFAVAPSFALSAKGLKYIQDVRRIMLVCILLFIAALTRIIMHFIPL